ncbi:MAG: hypothetical protein K0R28_6107 [Paenibacillus sp.]|jgi:hypothetical protein|nr:hypothetical protein [Paenibacillus sp.]
MGRIWRFEMQVPNPEQAIEFYVRRNDIGKSWKDKEARAFLMPEPSSVYKPYYGAYRTGLVNCSRAAK